MPGDGTGSGQRDHERDGRDHRQDRPVAEDELEVERHLEERSRLGVGDDEPDEQRDRDRATLDPEHDLTRAPPPSLDEEASHDEGRPDEDEGDSCGVRALPLEADQPGGDDHDPECPDGGDDDLRTMRRVRLWAGHPSVAGCRRRR